MREHRDACKRSVFDISAVAEHACNGNHSFKREEVFVLDHARGQELLLKEDMHNQMLALMTVTIEMMGWRYRVVGLRKQEVHFNSPCGHY